MKKGIKWKKAAMIIGALVLFFLLKNTFSSASGIMIGWVEQKQTDIWRANYVYFSGKTTAYLQGNTGNAEIEVDTVGGILHLTIQDDRGNLILTKEVKESETFQIEAPRKIEVSVSANGHRGSFRVYYLAKPELSEQAKKMTEDLDYFVNMLEKEHANLYANIDRLEFEKAKAGIAKEIENMSEDQFYYSLKSLASLVGDAHTDVQRHEMKDGDLEILPFQVKEYENKWRLIAINRENADQLGKEVHFINNLTMDQALEKMKTIFSFENETRAKSLFSKQSNLWQALIFLGMAEEGSGVELGIVQDNGDIQRIVIFPLKKGELTPEKIAVLRAEKLPETAKNGIYWAKDIREQVLFVQYNSCQEAPDLPMAQFTKLIEEALLKHNFKKLILDLRYNSGGNSLVLEPFMQMLENRQREMPLEVYTLIGKDTFSSAIMNAIAMKERLRATLVGTPTGGNVNAFGEVKTFSLKHFPITVSYSTKYFALIPNYDKDSLYPDILISQELARILSGHDLEVEWVIGH